MDEKARLAIVLEGRSSSPVRLSFITGKIEEVVIIKNAGGLYVQFEHTNTGKVRHENANFDALKHLVNLWGGSQPISAVLEDALGRKDLSEDARKRLNDALRYAKVLEAERVVIKWP